MESCPLNVVYLMQGTVFLPSAPTALSLLWVAPNLISALPNLSDASSSLHLFSCEVCSASLGITLRFIYMT